MIQYPITGMIPPRSVAALQTQGGTTNVPRSRDRRNSHRLGNARKIEAIPRAAWLWTCAGRPAGGTAPGAVDQTLAPGPKERTAFHRPNPGGRRPFRVEPTRSVDFFNGVDQPVMTENRRSGVDGIFCGDRNPVAGTQCFPVVENNRPIQNHHCRPNRAEEEA